jgi:hypothetical protein
MEKLGLESRAALVHYALERGWLHAPDDGCFAEHTSARQAFPDTVRHIPLQTRGNPCYAG